MISSPLALTTIPDVSETFTGQGFDLLDRLSQWPRYEATRVERAADIDHWRRIAQARRDHGEPRRVLFVHGQLPGETGSGVYLQQIAAESIRQGSDLHVLSAGYDLLGTGDIRGVPDERIHTCLYTRAGETPRPGAIKTPISGMSVVMPYHVLAYRDRTRDQLLDFLNIFGGRLAALVSRLQPDVIHVDHLWFLNGLARLVSPWIPLVASAHGTAHKLIVDAPRFRELVVPCVASAEHVCAISPDSVTECQEMFDVPAERISIEGYGYETDLFYYRRVDRNTVIRDILGVDLTQIERVVLAVGKFVDWKGFKELTRAIGRMRGQGLNVAALIVGEGDAESRADLEADIATQGLTQHVLLPGKVGREQLPDIYRAADVYVLPSHSEPYGLVLMEALACGAPSVCANTGGPPSYVPRGLQENGWVRMVDPIALTPTGEASDAAREAYAVNLAEGLRQVLQSGIGSDDRQQIAQAMRPLSWGRLVVSLGRIYDRVLDKALSAPPGVDH